LSRSQDFLRRKEGAYAEAFPGPESGALRFRA